MDLIEIIFFFCVSALAFVYSGYYLTCNYVNKTKILKIKNNKDFRPKVSIIIPTWNEEDVIEGKLKNTMELKYPKNKLEIIVIDSGSEDRTRDIVRKFKRFRKIKLIVEKERNGKANALNKVFRHCTGDIVVLSDADCRLKKDILLKSMPCFSDPSLGALTGKQTLINPDETLSTRIESKYRDFYYLLRNAESILDSTFIFHGEFSAFRKNLLDKIFCDSVADDSELALRIRKKNYRTILLPKAKYWEYAPSKLSDRTKQKYRRAQGLVQIMFRFFPTFFFNPKYKTFGMLIFPVEFFMHVISPFLTVLTILTLFLLPTRILLFLSGGILLLLLVPKFRSFILSFLHSQYACLKGIFSYILFEPKCSWEKIHGTRRYKNE
jgi:cellulose synthase/poly-beta-1,6-N-acetylglucosamine synthase-like glycosyltransferase